jgi:hypothetical protein
LGVLEFRIDDLFNGVSFFARDDGALGGIESEFASLVRWLSNDTEY